MMKKGYTLQFNPFAIVTIIVAQYKALTGKGLTNTENNPKPVATVTKTVMPTPTSTPVPTRTPISWSMACTCIEKTCTCVVK